MLWLKGWLETRWRFLFLLAVPLAAFVAPYTGGVNSPQEAGSMMRAMSFLWLLPALVLGGAGIKTQSAFRATKGLHGSMHYTLSLPVSRFRLVVVRAGIGLFETAVVILVVCCAAWALFPLVRASSTPADLSEFVLSAFVCTTGFYALSVLFATFLDDMWQVWGSMIAIGLLRWLTIRFPPPPSVDVFRAMGAASPLVTHTMPWIAMGVSLAIAAILFLAALKIVQAREY